MNFETIALEETDCFSSFFLDYIMKKEELTPFYHEFPTVAAFKEIIERRDFSKEKRATLTRVLDQQYQQLEVEAVVSENIVRLKDEKTFTVTTGHQLNIFTGPLYFIYKIVSAINACKQLKKHYPDYHFVPVYWMASEDHDFEEIQYFFLNGQKHIWETEQSGAVGRFQNETIRPLLKRLPGGTEFFKEAYQKTNLADAVRSYVNYLFGAEGLIVVDADDRSLKSLLIPVIKEDIFRNTPGKLVTETSAQLHDLGYKTQVNARTINFFYLDDGLRERIEKKEDRFEVLNTDLTFSSEEIEKEIELHPQKFSPNVVLRPLYQETILPNLAYIGGPSELVYWLQLKRVFTHFETPFPILMPRNFGLVFSSAILKKWQKLDLDLQKLFLPTHTLVTHWVEKNSDHDLSCQHELERLEELFSSLGEKVKKVDVTLAQHIEALKARSRNKLEAAEKKLLRAEKRKFADKQTQIVAVKDFFFPNGGLQERRDNFMNFYPENPEFLKELMDAFDPFCYKMYVFNMPTNH